MIEQKILQLIEEQFGFEPNTVKITDHLVNDLGGDSVDVLEVSMLMETEFKIEISAEETDSCLVIKDLLKLVEDKCRQK